MEAVRRKSSNGGEVAAPKRDRTHHSQELNKKQGGGKKGLWGKSTDVLTVPKADAGDPIYDSEGEGDIVLVSEMSMKQEAARAYRSGENTHGPEPKLSLAETKKRFVDILTEYFVSGDMEEVQQSVVELESEVFHYELVKKAITMSMDQHEKERELASKLLSGLYPQVLSTTQVGKGFERLLETVDDLILDTPGAREILATFMARAVVDEILPPSYLMDPLINHIGDDVVELAKQKLSINHGIARLEKGWGPGDGRPVEELKVAMDQLLQEYLISRDLREADRCVRELHVPHFHHELVKRGITNAMDKDEDSCQAMSSLLAYLVAEQVISMEQISQGFDKIKQVLEDLKLDVPNAEKVVSGFIERAMSDGILVETSCRPSDE